MAILSNEPAWPPLSLSASLPCSSRFGAGPSAPQAVKADRSVPGTVAAVRKADEAIYRVGLGTVQPFNKVSQLRDELEMSREDAFPHRFQNAGRDRPAWMDAPLLDRIFERHPVSTAPRLKMLRESIEPVDDYPRTALRIRSDYVTYRMPGIGKHANTRSRALSPLPAP